MKGLLLPLTLRFGVKRREIQIRTVQEADPEVDGTGVQNRANQEANGTIVHHRAVQGDNPEVDRT